MGIARHLWHFLIRSGLVEAPRARPRPTHAARDGGATAHPARDGGGTGKAPGRAAPVLFPLEPPPPQPKPPKWYRLREEIELALLLLWLPEASLPRCVAQMVASATRALPWPEVGGEPWQQCQRWGPLLIRQPETMSVEGFCHLLETELTAGLQTFKTPLEVLSRPVRMLWLLKLGKRAGQAYAGLEQALGSEERAVEYVWWTIARL